MITGRILLNLDILSPHVLGAWPYTEAISKGTEFEPTCMHRSNDEDLLVTGDTDGNVKVTKFPSVSKDTEPIRASGHVKDISKVRFTCDGKYAISVGKLDRTIITWKVLYETSKDLAITDGETAVEETKNSKKLGSKKKSTKKKAEEVAGEISDASNVSKK